jgi:small subunit ribosomal protein S16
MLRIRLSRVGAKRQPSYRIVVADVDARRDGRVVERIGFYNPRTEPESYRVDEHRALYWLSVGAQPSDAVRRLLDKQGTFDRLKRLHAGETLERLVAEYEGAPLPEPAKETAAAAKEEDAAAVAETALEAVSEVAETVSEAAEEAMSAAAEIAEAAAVAVADLVAGDEEE